MSQSRRMSAVESVVNVAVGYGVAVGTQVAVFPLVGVNLPLADNMLIGALFTVVSLVRSYLLRRLFDGLAEPSWIGWTCCNACRSHHHSRASAYIHWLWLRVTRRA